MKLNRFSRMVILCLALAALILPSAGRAFAQPLTLQDDASTPTSTTSGVSGNSYTSPSFGYSVAWDDTWTVSDEQNDNNYNKLVLDDGTSTVYFEGAAGSASMDDCLSTVSDSYKNVDGVTAFKEDRTADDPLSDNDPDRVWAIYTFTYSGSNGDVDLTVYIDCRPVDPGNSFVAIEWLTTSDSYDSELDGFVALMDGFATDGSTGPSDTGDSGNTGDTGNTSSSSDKQIENFIQISAKDVNDFWKREFPTISGGKAYTPPKDVIPFTADITTDGCGAASVGEGPFYCPADQNVYYDIAYAKQQIDNLGSESAIAVALAHEIGHHVQNLMQWKECLETPCLDPTEMTSQEIELQADCFAGLWTADAETRGRLGSFDVETNIVQFAAFLGDPRGNVADAGAHGKGARRVYSFLTGYYDGVQACLQISAASDPTRNGQATGGNTNDNGNGTEPTETPTTNGNTKPTKTPTPRTNDEPTETPTTSGETVQIGDDYTVDFKDNSFAMNVSQTQITDDLGVDGAPAPDGTYLVIIFSVQADSAGPFPFENFIVTDSDGNQYDVALDATDALLKTSDTLPDGTDQELDPGSSYNLAIVFDVPTDASGFVFSTDTGDGAVQLDV